MTSVSDFFEHILDVEGKILLWTLNHRTREKHSLWFDDASAVAHAVERLGEFHVYFGVGSRREDLGPGLRGGDVDCFQFRSLWLDLDVLGENHKSDHLPPSIKDAETLLAKMPLPPSCVVSSGGGLQAYWLLTEPAEASELKPFLHGWFSTWKSFGKEFGWHVDNVFDLARVMRAPGSVNRKNDVRVEILSADWSRTYNLSDFDPYLREDEVEAPEVVQRPAGAAERPGDAYNRIHGADPVSHAQKVLSDYGFKPLRAKSNGEMPYVRPGKSGGDSSATIYPDGHVTVYSDDPSLPTTQAEKTRLPLDPYALYAMFVHNGDWSAAAAALRSEGFGDPIPNEHEDAMWLLEDPLPSLSPVVASPDGVADSWRSMSLFDASDEPEEHPPAVGRRGDGVYLLYKGKVHTVFGEPGGMKSWFTQLIAAQVVEDGRRALFVDFENSRRSLLDRFGYLGLTGDDFRNIDTVHPDCPFGPAERAWIEAECAEKQYDLIVVDGTTDAMVTFGLDPNGSVDAARFDKGFLKPLAATGAAVIYVDHVTKSTENRGSWGFGSQHKKSAIDGASFGVEMISSFGKGMFGKARILIHKDKPGDLLQHSLEGVHTTIAELQMVSDPMTSNITARIDAPSVQDNPNFRPTMFMGKIAEYVQANPGLSKEVIITGCGLSNTSKKEWVRVAFEKLEAEGYIAGDLGSDPRDRRWRSVKPYDELQDGLDHDRPTALSKTQEESITNLQKRFDRTFGVEEKPAQTEFFNAGAVSGASHSEDRDISAFDDFVKNL